MTATTATTTASATPSATASAGVREFPTPGEAAVATVAAKQTRLLVVSNRLPPAPDTAGGVAAPQFTITMSSGGLVSALSGAKKDMPFTWIGWPGLSFPEHEQDAISGMLFDQHSCVPVFLEDDLADAHYNGFSNSILWPLFHYHQGDISFDDEIWHAYEEANRRFASAIMKHVQDGDLVWVHDYHLMLLPEMLRDMLEERGMHKVRIGWFLHTPFPSSEIYRILPVREEILRGVLSADLVGFHTHDYARHFLSSCARILGLPTLPKGVEFRGRDVNVGTFPIGIDPQQFTEGLRRPSIRERINKLTSRFKDMKVIVGVDRLDYIKGVPQKLHALEVFLENHPEFIGKVVLVQVAVPSRSDVEEYQHLISNVHELVGRINGKYSTVDYSPIQFLHKSVSFEELVSLYAVADACLVTSTRDGMNLVSYEYIACQQDEKHGVLILSEFAGAAQSLNGSVIVNPWSTDDLANAINTALTMSPAQRAANHHKLYKYVTKYTASFWAASFVSALQTVGADKTSASMLPPLTSSEISTVAAPEAVRRARIIMLDYDGTINPIYRIPELGRPDTTIIDVLRKLTSLPDTFVYILSGRRRSVLEEWFSGVDIGLVAEHGCFHRHPQSLKKRLETSLTAAAVASGGAFGGPGTDEWIRHAEPFDPAWREAIAPVLEYYRLRTPGSTIEEKEINISWFYNNTDHEFGQWQANELKLNLEKTLSHLPLSV
ncbi:hypothetical protein GQ42DRAFT_121901, partial [Ramicandelaber brevisporus]